MKLHIVFLFNGIGNQLSQYALYKQLKNDSYKAYLIDNCKVIPNYTEGLDILKLSPQIKNELMHKWLAGLVIFYVKLNGQKKYKLLSGFIKLFSYIFSLSIINENSIYHKKSFINIYVDGWLNKVIKNPCDIYNSAFKNFINQNCKLDKRFIKEDVCAIHFRGGDYIDGGINSKIYGDISNVDYYSRAIKKIKSKKGISKFIIFTNDKTHADVLFKSLNIDFIYSSDIGSKSFLEDLCSMSYFKNIIISNSSFSFWSAATFNDDKIVICPKKYRNFDDIDIYLDHWDAI